MRVLVCGGRDFSEEKVLHDFLNTLFSNYFEPTKREDLFVISGMANGADSLAAKWARYWGFNLLEFPANWDRYGSRAGPIRNQQMLDEGKPDLVIAFPTAKSRGTWDMVRRAEKAGVETIVYQDENG